jgi:hypothetical protein
MAVVHNSTIVDEDLRPIQTGIHLGILRALLLGDPLHVPHGSQMLFRSELVRVVPVGDRPVSVYGGRPQEHDEWAFFAARALGRVRSVRRSLNLHRRHAGAVGHAHGHESRRVLLHSDARRDVRLAAARDRARFLRSLAPGTDEWRGRLDESAARYERFARNLEWQRSLHARPRSTVDRVRRVLSGVARSSYRSFDGGGLGALAFVRDVMGEQR